MTDPTLDAAAAAASHALHAGARAPLFALDDATGASIELEHLLRRGPVVLHFVRGAWCRFSEESLDQFASTHREVVALGGSAVAIAPAIDEKVRAEALPMPELRDVDMRVARQFGLAYSLPTSQRARYRRLGYRPPTPNVPGEWLVPLTATYLVDRDGTIVFASVDADYHHPFEPVSLLTALKAFQARTRQESGLVAKRRATQVDPSPDHRSR